MFNPFRPGNGVLPPYLAGRDKELKEFERSLETALILPRNLVITGLRGTGKTVLLRKFESLCEKKKWLFVRREFNPKLCKETDFLIALLTDIITKVKGVSLAKELSRPLMGFGPLRKAEPEPEFIFQLLEGCA
jgi:Cdc6-like AAA superfamily ATPase